MQPFTPKYVYAPVLQLDAQKRQAFRNLFTAILDRPDSSVPSIPYTYPYPKYEFLNYLIDHHHVLVHGTNDMMIDILEPLAESDKAGVVMRAVFAASDGIWSMFFAILDRKPYPYSLHHGCRQKPDGAGGLHKEYYFSTSTFHDKPWISGMIYILPRDTFTQQRNGEGELYDEWASYVAVRPLAKLSITPADFPFLNDVQYHVHK
ncbi:hypothetical protein ACFL6S_25515 [Candidatus Poribacteria bacterium]